jgi:hypothetical protein
MAICRLVVSKEAVGGERVLDIRGLSDSVFLPEQAFPPGRYMWHWESAEGKSEVFRFEITSVAVALEIPAVDEWLRRLPRGHPRIFVRPEDVESLQASRHTYRAAAWNELETTAKSLVQAEHELPEPPFLPDWSENYQSAFESWHKIMWSSRRFVKEAECLALAHLASGNAAYARAACLRLASIARWDPEGSSHLTHNDEAHMAMIWHGPQACDWVWDRFTDEERTRVISQFQRRGQLTFEHMRLKGSYGIIRFDSHAGREIVFLAMIALVFHEYIPEARRWLEWLRPVLCGIWPVWAGDDGAWAEGPAYGLPYVSIMTQFASALKRGTAVDLYRRPFWIGHAEWRRAIWPAYAEWIGFGDHSERTQEFWSASTELMEIVARETGRSEFMRYANDLREELPVCAPTAQERKLPVYVAQNYLTSLPTNDASASYAKKREILSIFPAAGQAIIRTVPEDRDRDVAFLFRSSPYGSISHSHANNNDFILHVGGKAMAIPSGYYDGYDSPHHLHWMHHTKSHNCVTLSDAPQVMKSHNSTGKIIAAFENDELAYFQGDSDASYRDRTTRCRRHVCYLKNHGCFLLLDEFQAVPGIASTLQWNMHSWSRFELNRLEQSFRIERDGRSVHAAFLHHGNGYFSTSEGWDPPFMDSRKSAQWQPQHHIKFSLPGLGGEGRLGVLLFPRLKSETCESPVTLRSGNAEVARLGDDLVIVNQGAEGTHDKFSTQKLALLVLGGSRYEIGIDGLESLT